MFEKTEPDHKADLRYREPELLGDAIIAVGKDNTPLAMQRSQKGTGENVKLRFAPLFCVVATILIGSSAFSADNVDLDLGMAAFAAGQYPKALELLAPLAEKGDPKAQAVLGYLFEEGLGVPRDYSRAAHWFRKSAEQGSTPAQYALGTMYVNGRGVAQDNVQAAYWFRKSAEQGNAPAQYALGTMYVNGRGVAQDNVQAAYWFRKSAEQGNAPAQYALGIMYVNGRGVAQDNVQAAFWFRETADQGDAWGQYYLGTMYLRGQGVTQDNVEAVRWLRKSADQGNVMGQAALGFLYATGTAVPRSCGDSAGWYRKAGDGGHPRLRGFFAAREALERIRNSYLHEINGHDLLRRTLRRFGDRSAGKILVEERGDSIRLSCGRRGMTVAYSSLSDEVIVDILQGMKPLVRDCLEGDRDAREGDFERRILEALMSSLEKSSYLSCEEVGARAALNEETTGRIGMEFQAVAAGLLVLEAFEGAPAFRAGLRAGDKIVEIDGRSAEELSAAEAAMRLTGKAGTTVTLGVVSATTAEPKKVTMTREIVKIEDVTSKNLDGGIGYLRIRSFRSGTDSRLDEALRDISRKEGLKGLILDLRRCSGGLLDQAAKISGQFIEAGPVALLKSRKKDQVLATDRSSQRKVHEGFPMVVLCDSATAFGAEVVAAALKERGRATIVGVPTSGTGSVQTSYSLSDGSALRLETATLSTSKGNPIDGTGVQPDILVRGGDGDAAIECGIRVLKGKASEGGSGACR